MGRIVEFNEANWELIYNFSTTAVLFSANSYTPISPIDAPILLETDIVAVYIDTTVPDGRNWRYGGYTEQRFRSGIIIGGSNDAAGEPYNLWIGKITTLFFPRISAQYSLKFYPPKWFKDVSLQVWQYTGIDDESSDIASVQEFSNINFKLDQLLEKVNAV
ncbi:hypothetical protein [Cylindrospermum sp. FACHB-282]|uniref:hypothetical protein n=1 Tax=Cylindrospermum sp. FACHB-282 TaxID=2692794 RepID=UPI0016821BF1|nr:hypothetical protein [Cylindrospermum sp. FACHB-282]MBD2388446.1 hypothetical protein [Cylindrospermum sp. FACHB-282]